MSIYTTRFLFLCDLQNNLSLKSSSSAIVELFIRKILLGNKFIYLSFEHIKKPTFQNNSVMDMGKEKVSLNRNLFDKDPRNADRDIYDGSWTLNLMIKSAHQVFISNRDS